MKNKNVVILMTDQQRWDTIRCLGNSTIRTPNLDRLCQTGVAFTHAFSPVPVCSPARDRLFTGADSAMLGEVNSHLRWRPNIRPLQSALAEAGYKTGGFGKMHFKPTRDSHGFTHFALHEEMQSAGREYCEDSDYFSYLRDQGLGHIRYPCGVRGLLYSQPQISPIPEEHHETKWVADQALDFIDTFHKAPFLCFASWMQPHWPVHVPKEWADMYSIDDIAPPVWSEEEQADMPWNARLMRRAADMADEGEAPAMERMLRAKALYYASISYIDHQIGRILERLEQYGLMDDTLIIFTSDHGEMLFDHLTTAKCLPYEPSVRIPLIVSGPGMQQPGTPSDDFTTLMDIAPTVYEFTGVQPSECTPIAGASLLGEREDVHARQEVFTEIGGEGTGGGGFVCIRTRQWKYAFNHYAGVKQLFNLESDPNELENLLLGNPSGEILKTAEDFHRRLLEWSRKHSVASRIVGDDFYTAPEPPLYPDRNAQREDFVDNLPDNEKAALWSEARSVYEAIKDEKHLDVADLDLEHWERKRGKGCIAELEQLMNRKLR